MLLAIYALSQLASSYFMSATMEKTQRIMLLVLPIVFIPFIINFPVGLVLYWMTTNLWTVGQGLVTRRLMPRPAAAREALVAHAAEGGRRPRSAPAKPAAAPPAKPVAAAAGQAQEEAGRAGDRDRVVQVEATGETVGEAKWAALRELEKLRPGIDKAAVRFQVVSEGERGLLGVGYAPARVVASVDAAPRSRQPPAAAGRREASRPPRCASVVEQILEAIGVRARVEIAEDDERVTATVRRPRARARDRQARADDRRDPVPRERDRLARPRRRAQGGGRRRRRLPRAGARRRSRRLANRSAERAIASARSVELEPMTAVERKVVHVRLKDFAGVDTRSEGTEPNRFVVIDPV